MKFYFVRLVDWKKGIIDAFHAEMFHGLASRNGFEHPHNEYYDITSKLMFPLDIVRNGFRIPDVTKPAENLVLANCVREQLEGLPGIKFYGVRLLKLFCYPWKVGDFSHHLRPNEQLDLSNWEFFETLPDVPEYHKQAGSYYELLHMKPISIRSRYAFTETPTVLNADFPFSRRILEESSVLRADGGYFVTRQVFEAMASFLDNDFYETEELTL